MNKLITTTALALMIAAPAYAQTTTTQEAQGAVVNDANEKLDASSPEDVEMEMEDADFRIFRAADGRRFRLPRAMFGNGMEADQERGAVVNDANEKIEESSPAKSN